MNTYDWLVNLPISDAEQACRVIEVSFSQGSRKDFYRNTSLHLFEKGEIVAGCPKGRVTRADVYVEFNIPAIQTG